MVLALVAGLAATVAGGLTGISGFLAGASADEIDVDFTRQSYDRWLFRPEAGLDGGRWDTKGNGLHASVPKGQPSRGPLRFRGLMHLEGDFEIVADFEIISLPRPAEPPPKGTVKDPTNNIEIFLYAPEVMVTVFRDHRPSGEGWGFYARSPEGGSTLRHFPATGKSGRLGVRRSGNQLTFLHSGVDETLVEMGTVTFSTEPITELGLQALALRSPDAIDVRFERLSIKADKIVRLEKPPSTGWGSGTWLTLAAVVAVFIGGIAAWRLRSGRDEQPKPKPGVKPAVTAPRTSGREAVRREAESWVHAHRALGRHHGDRHPRRPSAAGRPGCARGGAASPVREQPQADRSGPCQLPVGLTGLPVRGWWRRSTRQRGQPLVGPVAASPLPRAARPLQRAQFRRDPVVELQPRIRADESDRHHDQNRGLSLPGRCRPD